MGTMAGSVEEIGAAAAAPQALELHAVQHLGEMRSAFESGRTRPLAWRQDQLRGLLRLLANKEEEAFRALHDELGKHRAEVGVIIKSANAALREIGKWVAPEKVWVPLVAFPASAQVVPEPLGVVLIFSCWNFPLAGEHRRSQRGRADEEKLVRRILEVRRDCDWTCTQPGGQRCNLRLHRDCRCLGAPCGNTRSPTLSRSSSLLPWSATRGRLARCKVGVRACGAGQTSAAALAFSPGRQHVDGPVRCRVGARRAVLAGPQQEPWPSPLDDNEWTAMAVQGRCRERGAGQTCWVLAVSGFKVLPARAEWELVETLGVV